MTRLAFSGDQHIGARHLTTPAEQETALLAFAEESVRRGSRAIVLLGDATHSPRPTPEDLRIWGNALRVWQRASTRVIALKGNHEGDGVTSLLEHFRGSITAVTRPQLIQDLYGVDLACLPWIPDNYVRAAGEGALPREEVARRLTEAARDFLRGFAAAKRPRYPLVLATHATIAGAGTSTGFNMGYLAGEHYIVPIEELAAFDFVAAAHIHRHQELAPRIVYTGSLLPLDFSESEPKGFLVAAFTGARDSAGRAAVLCEFVRVESPTIGTIDVTSREGIAEVVDGDYLSRIPLPSKVRVRLVCDEATAREYTPARIEQSLRARGIAMVQVEITVDSRDRVRDAEVTSELTPAQALEHWIETRPDLQNADRIRELATQILENQRGRDRELGRGDLEIQSIDVSNLLGVRAARVVFDGEGVYGITGPVGAGKSTIGGDALRFALFGSSRAGAKVTDQLVRQGADLATVSIELRSAAGPRYRVIRKLKRTPRGSTSTLDVLRARGALDGDPLWVPITDGKIASGQLVVDGILGGLSDVTFTASSIVVQRNADTFARARSEERKQILAAAAGLGVYEELAGATRDSLRAAERALELLHAKAEPLRARAGTIAALQAELTAARAAADETAVKAAELETSIEVTRRMVDGIRARVATFEMLRAEIAELQRQVTPLDDELAEWSRKKAAADTIVAAKAQLQRAATDLDTLRGEITRLEEQLRDEDRRQREHDAKKLELARMRERYQQLRMARDRETALLSQRIEAGERESEKLEKAKCCEPEPSCVFIDDARMKSAELSGLYEALAESMVDGDEEHALFVAIDRFEIPPAPKSEPTREALARARTRSRELERETLVAQKIAAAEQVQREHNEATVRIRLRRGVVDGRISEKRAELTRLGDDPRAELTKLERELADLILNFDAAREILAGNRDRVSQLQGRIDTLRDAATELAAIELRIAAAALDVAAWKVLTGAWASCRVLVLENSVIPSVEQTANDVLRRFPYGLQIAFATQREKRASDGVSETLDIEVLGGRGPIYELCSGGQKTVIDFALHVAIALVVSRRSSTRIRFLFADEPEGLDEPGRAAFAAIARWIHETFGLTVLVASHAADLVDALGGQRIDVVPGPDGSTVEVAS